MLNQEVAETLGDKIEQTIEVAEEAVQLPFVKRLARLGFYTKGMLFIVIGILSILLVVGLEGGKITDATGALATVALRPYGKILLIIFIIGACGHGLWNILRGAADVDEAGKNLKGIIIRIFQIGVGIFYLGLAWSAFDIVMSAQVSAANGDLPKTLTAILFTLPLGGVLVFLIGLGMFGASLHEGYSGITGKFQENYRSWEIAESHQKFINVLGVLSFTARALILALIGYFFISAAVDYNENEVSGIDGALLVLSQSYFGKAFLFVTAVGLVGYGILAIYEARYRRIC